jgi:hypothetical protein
LFLLLQFIFFLKLQDECQYDVFINYFEWNRIQPCKTDDDPISIYGKEYFIDQNKVAVVNLALNPEILKKYGCESPNKDGELEMLIELSFKFVEQQNKVQISRPGYKILKKTKCYGDLADNIKRLSNNKKNVDITNDFELAKEAFESIKSDSNLPESILNKLATINVHPNTKSDQQNKLIEEFTAENDHAKKQLISEVSEVPSYEIKVKNNKKIIDIKISIPNLDSMKDCQLKIEPEDDNDDKNDKSLNLIIKDSQLYSPLKIHFKPYLKSDNYSVDSQNIEAKFIKKIGLLRVTVPLVVNQK